jgi:hypothetical protein
MIFHFLPEVIFLTHQGVQTMGIGIYANVFAPQKHLRRLGIGIAPKIKFLCTIIMRDWELGIGVAD